MRDWSIGICTPIPRVPIDQAAVQRHKVRQALEDLDNARQPPDLEHARTLLRESLDQAPSSQTHLGLITPEWQRARQALQTPMGHRCVDVYADGMEVGKARCEAVEAARQANLRFLFFLDWDVIVPQDTLLKLTYHLENKPDYDVASGVYCHKAHPSPPLLWAEWHNGVTYDWTAGDLLLEGIKGVPMGCALLRLSLFDKLEQTADNPWFKTVDRPILVDGAYQHCRITEDLWFCKRLEEESHAKILVDTSILCHHICHNTGERYRLADDSLPMKRAKARAASAAT